MDDNQTVARLRTLWAGVLGVPEISDTSNFFELGGHSMLATRLISRAERALGAALPVALPFEHPVFGDFAAQAAKIAAGGDARHRPAPAPGAVSTAPPAMQQEALLALEEALGPSPASNITVCVALGAPVDAGELRADLDALVARHPALRLSVRRGADGYTQTAVPASAVELDELRCTTDAQARRAIRRAYLRPFDLAAGALLRAQLIRRDDGDLLALHTHHLACDGVSLGFLLDELATGRAEPVRHTYLDYATWQRAGAAAAVTSSRAYWRQVVRALAADPARHTAPRPAGGRAVRSTAAVGASVLGGITAWSAADGGTGFAALAAAAVVALSQLTGQRQAGIGTLLNNRSVPEFERVVGPFATSTLLAVEVDPGDTPRRLVRRVRDALLAVSRWAAIPLERLTDEPATDLGMEAADLVDLVVSLDRPYRSPAGARRPMAQLTDGTKPLAGLLAGHQRELIGTVGDDGALTLVVDHRDDPADRERCEQLLARTVAALAGFARDPDRTIAPAGPG